MTAQDDSLLWSLSADSRHLLAGHDAEMAACVALSLKSGRMLGELQTTICRTHETIARSYHILTKSRALWK